MSRPLEKVTNAKMVWFGIGSAIFLLVLHQSEPGFMFGVDMANLLFHEAGHPLVGSISATMETYGGTIGQLVIPALLAFAFWRKRQTVALAATMIWFFENFLNIARYVADARAQELPLVGGGDHDWNRILSRWNALDQDTAIGGWLRTTGWIGMTAAVAWVCWRWWHDRRNRLADDALQQLWAANVERTHSTDESVSSPEGLPMRPRSTPL